MIVVDSIIIVVDQVVEHGLKVILMFSFLLQLVDELPPHLNAWVEAFILLLLLLFLGFKFSLNTGCFACSRCLLCFLKVEIVNGLAGSVRIILLEWAYALLGLPRGFQDVDVSELVEQLFGIIVVIRTFRP